VVPSRPAPRTVCARTFSPPDCRGPAISPDVGYGQTNVCSEGSWQHYPTRFAWEWLVKPYRRSPDSAATTVGQGPTLRIGAAEEHEYLFCRVTASNSAGSGSADSNGYLVPARGFSVVKAAQVEVRVPAEPARDRIDPSTSPTDPLEPNAQGQFGFVCRAPAFNRPADRLEFWWEIDNVSGSATGLDARSGGIFLSLDTSTSPIRYRTTGGTNYSSGTFPLGGISRVRCQVDGSTKAGLSATSYSKWVYIDLGIAFAAPKP
jgi:hypothetical protein